MAHKRDVIEEILAQVKLTDLARDLGLKVERKGNDWVALCPFHDDHHPSLHFFEGQHPHFHCYACAAHGDALHLVQHCQRTDFRGALEWLANYARIDLPVVRKQAGAIASRSAGLRLGWEHLSKSGVKDQGGRAAWLVERQLEERTAVAAELVALKGKPFTGGGRRGAHLAGWSREEWESLEAAGLVYTRKRSGQTGIDSSGHLDLDLIPQDIFWYPSVIFPLHDQHGRLSGFAGRKIEPSVYEGPKYRYTAGFKRSQCLYRMHVVRRKAVAPTQTQEKGNLTPFEMFLVEGLTDALRLEQLGFAAVAVLGSSLSGKSDEPDSQMGQIAALARDLGERSLQIHFFLDADDAGKKGMLRALPQLLRLSNDLPNLFVDCVLPPENVEGKDPDDLLRGLASADDAKGKLQDWICPPVAFAVAQELDGDVAELSNLWTELTSLQRSESVYRITRRLALDDLRDPHRAFAARMGDAESDSEQEDWAQGIIRPLSKVPGRRRIPAPIRGKEQQFEALESELQVALGIAEVSYQNLDFPHDAGSWQRLHLAGRLLTKEHARFLEQCSGQLEPYMPALTPRDGGGDPRLKVLPCVEDLVLETYVLRRLFEFGIDVPGTIPLVVHDETLKRPHTLAPAQFMPADAETVSFAYQVSSDAVGRESHEARGLFRHFADCWGEFNNFILKRADKCPKNQGVLYAARLDIRRYYDSLSQTAVRSVLRPCIEAACAEAASESVVPFLDEPEKSQSDRVNDICKWLFERSFGYEYYSPQDGRKLPWNNPDVGIPQGPNLSAWLANIVLFPVDQVLSKAVKQLNNAYQQDNPDQPQAVVATYARYVDDVILLVPSEQELKRLTRTLSAELAKIRLELNPKTKPLPPMNLDEVRKWLLENRGVAGGGSGPWEAPVALPDMLSMQFRALHDTIDRREALALLHSQQMLFHGMPRNRFLQVIQTVARRSDEVRYRDYRAIALKLWLNIAEQYIEKSKHPDAKVAAADFADLWHRHVKPYPTGKDKHVPIMDTFRLAGSEEAFGLIWPLCVALEGLQGALMSRQDRSLVLDDEARTAISQRRELLAQLVRKGLANEFQKLDIPGFSPVFPQWVLELFGTMLAARSSALYRMALSVLNQVPDNTAPADQFPKALFRLSLSSSQLRAVEDRPPFATVEPTRALWEHLLFHETIERLMRWNGGADGRDPLNSTRPELDRLTDGDVDLCSELLQALYLLHAQPQQDGEIEDSEVVAPDGLRLRVLDAFARCVQPDQQLSLLEKRHHLLQGLLPVVRPPQILPTPDGIPVRAVLACTLDSSKNVTELHVVSRRHGEDDEWSIDTHQLVCSEAEQSWQPPAANRAEATEFRSLSVTVSESPAQLAIRLNLGDQSATQKLAMAASCMRALLQQIGRSEDVVLSAWNILRCGDSYSAFAYREPNVELLRGRAFASPNLRYGSIACEVPPENDWLWRIGYAVTGILELHRETDHSEFSRLSRPAHTHPDDWAAESLLQDSMRILQGQCWWSRPEPDAKSTPGVVLPRAVENTLCCMELVAGLGGGHKEQCTKLAAVLSCRMISRLMRLVRDAAEESDRCGVASVLLFQLAPELIRADEGLAQHMETLRLQSAQPAAPLRRQVASWYTLAGIFRSLLAKMGDAPEPVRKGLSTAIASCSVHALGLNLRALVMELGGHPNARSLADVVQSQADQLGEFIALIPADVLLHPDIASDSDLLTNLGALASRVDALSSAHASQRSQDFGKVSPVGWALLGLALASNRGMGSNQDAEVDAFRTVLSHVTSCPLSEKPDQVAGQPAAGAERPADFPWAWVDSCVPIWADGTALDDCLVHLSNLDTALGLKTVAAVRGSYPMLAVTDGGITFQSPGGSRMKLRQEQVSVTRLRGERADALEHETTPEGELMYCWSETRLDGRLVGVGMGSLGLASFWARTTSGPTAVPLPTGTPSPPPERTEDSARREASVDEGEETDTPAQSPGDEDHTPEGGSSDVPPLGLRPPGNSGGDAGGSAQEPSPASSDESPLGKLRVRQCALWRGRSERNGNHIRVAFLQYGVEESYSHPLRELCLRDFEAGNGGQLSQQKVRTKTSPHLWQQTDVRPSCSEYRRRQLLGEVLNACHAFGVDILLLPEYSVRPETVQFISEKLHGLGNDSLHVWAGTCLLPSLFKGRPVFEQHPGSTAVLSVVNSKRVAGSRGKRYPALALGEQFRPAPPEECIEPLFKSVSRDKDARKATPTGVCPGHFVIELICSEIFTATSPANMHSSMQAYAQLCRHFGVHNTKDPSREKKDIEDVVVTDLQVFSKHTSFAPRLGEDWLETFPRRTILLVPAMSTRGVDFHTLGKANNLAASMCTVFCNAVLKDLGKGESCFIGHGATRGPDHLPWWDDSISPYHGVYPGILKEGHRKAGPLGQNEQALVITDIDPVYMNEGKPRQQSLPNPMQLVAHLPIVEFVSAPVKKACELKEPCTCLRMSRQAGETHKPPEFIETVVDILNSWPEEPPTRDCDDSAAREAHRRIVKVLKVIEKREEDRSSWLKERREAFEQRCHLIRSPWPPSVLYDWLPVDLDFSEVADVKIEVPEVAWSDPTTPPGYPSGDEQDEGSDGSEHVDSQAPKSAPEPNAEMQPEASAENEPPQEQS